MRILSITAILSATVVLTLSTIPIENQYVGNIYTQIVLVLTEHLCMIWFAVEYSLRFFSE